MLLSRWYGKGIGKELSEFSLLLESADQTKSIDEVSSIIKEVIIFCSSKLLAK
jgi:hypothetical protein